MRLAEGERLVPAALHLAHEEDPEADEEQDGGPGDEHVGPGGGRVGLVGHDHVLGEQAVRELVVAEGGEGAERLAAHGVALDLVAGDGDVGHLPGLDLGHELAELDGRLLLLELGEVPGQEHDDQEGHPQHHGLERGVHEILDLRTGPTPVPFPPDPGGIIHLSLPPEGLQRGLGMVPMKGSPRKRSIQSRP